MTEKLFDDGMLMEFDAVVISCIPVKKGCEIILDRSAFFPEGGGQYGDVGHLGGSEVTDTYEKNGEVIHLCTSPLAPGTHVHGEVNENIRLRRMQDHSGEHLLMGMIHNRYGLDNVGFHLGQSEVLLDLNGRVSAEDLRTCEYEANAAIAKDIPFTIFYPSPDELPSVNYRSKLDMTENVRLVRIGDIDICACCAPHVRSTGQIGIIKILSSENYKGGTRVHMLCGLDAFDEVCRRMDSFSEISELLSSKPEKITENVKRILTENNDLKIKLFRTEKLKTDEIIASMKNESRKSFCIFTSGIRNDLMREIANKAVLLTDGIAGVFGETPDGFSYIIASSSIPLRKKASQINSALNGKGGGSDVMIQGNVRADRNSIEKFFADPEI